jgi:hypothetical protein
MRELFVLSLKIEMEKSVVWKKLLKFTKSLFTKRKNNAERILPQ